MIYYFIALFVWKIKIILWLSILGIPIERYLSDKVDFFSRPFKHARIKNIGE